MSSSFPIRVGLTAFLFALIFYFVLLITFISQDGGNNLRSNHHKEILFNYKSQSSRVIKISQNKTIEAVEIPVHNLTIPPTKEEPITTVLVVLGNEPLDDQTPTVDTMTRVKTAVSYYLQNSRTTIIVFTGGPTAGKSSEAQMMATYAKSLGVPDKSILLEEKARSTGENAQLTALLLWKQKINPKTVYVVSKYDHLEWAIPIFKKHKGPVDVFKNVKPLGCTISQSEILEQMENYINQHPKNSPSTQRVLWRLKNIKKGIRGID